MQPMLVLAISGSLRAASVNTALLRACVLLAPPQMRVVLSTDIGLLPHFNADLDTETPPPPVVQWRAQVGSANALLIASPEYARGVPGAIKNALDWLAGSTDVVDKPVALINGSPRATIAQESLALTLGTVSAKVISPQAYSAPIAGQAPAPEVIAADPILAAPLRRALDDLLHAIRAIREASP
jgi:NAD(P)H-dependent FMN reductase